MKLLAGALFGLMWGIIATYCGFNIGHVEFWVITIPGNIVTAFLTNYIFMGK